MAEEPDEPADGRRPGWPPRGIAISLLISMAAWLLFGAPGNGGQDVPVPGVRDGWSLRLGRQVADARCGWEGNWAALEYVAERPTRIGESLRVQPGDRWEFESADEAYDLHLALTGSPAPGSPQEGMDEVELADSLQDVPANWRYGGRTACVGDRYGS